MEIDLQVNDTVVQIVTHKMVMAKIEPMISMAVQEEVMIGMEVVCQLEMKEGVTGVGLVPMTAQAGAVVHLHSTATDCFSLVYSSDREWPPYSRLVGT